MHNKMKLALSSSFKILFLTFLFCACSQDEGLDLIANDSIELLEQKGGKAIYTLENGILTGIAKSNTHNSFLCTKENYSNFILDFSMSIDPRLNSGVQIRSKVIDVNNKEALKGYQVEIDPSERAWSGGIYEESDRGWISNLAKNPAGRKAFKNGAWNHYHIEAIDSSIRVWVNGINTANLLDKNCVSGVIGFQVHSISDESLENTQVQWKDIVLRTENLDKHRFPLKPDDTEINLIPNTLSKKEKKKGWKLIQSKNLLQSMALEQFEFQLEYKLKKGTGGKITYGIIDSTEQKLSYPVLDDNNATHVQFHNQKSGALMGIYSAQNLSIPGAAKAMRAHDQWSQVLISVTKDSVEHWLNNNKVLAYDLNDLEMRPTHFTIELDDENGNVQFRDIKILNLVH